MGIRFVSALILLLGCILACPTIGTCGILSSDFIYFPDQAEYLKQAMRCTDNMIFWPADGRCYREDEQGPCNIGRILIFDKRLLKPFCKDSY
ncbi:hypothetical protein KM043_010945 [Ampulex compressa]|nr:hypothetical protein KM043_010945 [Ampulex compressa]